MDQKKSNVVKSKSSNSAIPTKNERANSKNKKTYSNVEVQPSGTAVKKRGVYVEKKPYKIGRLSPGQSTKKTDSPNQSPASSPPPRRNRKKFLASVLTILSQNTTSTQYPEKIEKPNRRDSKDVVSKLFCSPGSRRRLSSPIPTMMNQKNEPRKPKYRSKTLNNLNAIDQFIVWKKDMKPSPDGSASSVSNSRLRIRCDDETDRSSPICKEVAEGKQLRGSKMQQRMELEPDTLVSQSKANEDKSGIYDFFVDLLETTLNVYNVKTEVDVNANLSKESNLKLEIDESVAIKLNDIANDLTKKPSKIFSIADEISAQKTVTNSSPKMSENIDLADDFIQGRTSWSPSRNPRSCTRSRMGMSPTNRSRASRSPGTKSRASKSPGRSMYSQSYAYAEKYKINSPNAQSVVMSNVSKKKHKKQSLLGMLKEELSINDYVYEEPQNLFEALKIMARNKRRSKTIQFADNVKPDEDFRRSECMKRKKLISSRPKKSIKRTTDYNIMETYRTSNIFNRSSSYKSKSESEYMGDTESYHSLEVYDLGYVDYDPPASQTLPPVKLPPKKARRRPINKTIVYAVPSESSISVGYVRADDDNDGTFRNFAETIVNAIDYRKANNENVKSVSRFIMD